MNRKLIPLEIKPKVSDAAMRKFFQSPEGVEALIDILRSVKIEQKDPFTYPHFYYIRRPSDGK